MVSRLNGWDNNIDRRDEWCGDTKTDLRDKENSLKYLKGKHELSQSSE